MKIKTEHFKELLNKAIQGASLDKRMPITTIIGISQMGSKLTLTTTDGTTYLYVYGSCEDNMNFSVCPYIEQLSKLVSKMTSEYITLSLVDGGLEVKGNGVYMIELPPDENGELETYPDPYHKYINDKKIKFSKVKIMQDDVKAIIESVRPSLAVITERPSITNYYVGTSVVATDRYKVASYNTRLLKGEVLVSKRIMDVINMFDEDMSYFIDTNVMIFESEACTIFSRHVDDISEFPKEIVDQLLDGDFESICKVDKNSFIALLERIALFVGKYDDRAVTLSFEKDGIRVLNKSQKSNEFIEYVDSSHYNEYSCLIDVDLLIAQLKAYDDECVEIHYNNPATIKFVGNDITYIIALMTD